MSFDSNPQARQMADASMIRNLDAQARAIWPQELPLLRAYGLPDGIEVLDAGCGPGEITSRLAELFPGARVTGVDLLEAHLGLARERYPHLLDRVRFVQADVFQLPFEDGGFDLTVCRHMIQAIPQATRALAELVRVTRPGGRLHVIAEDYGMIHFHPVSQGVEAFWREGPNAFGRALDTDLFVGRRTFTHLRRLGLTGVRVDYVVVDSVRVPRETMAAIFEAWRDGYADAVAQHTRFSAGEVRGFFEETIACIRNPEGYAVWQVPVVTGVVPSR